MYSTNLDVQEQYNLYFCLGIDPTDSGPENLLKSACFEPKEILAAFLSTESYRFTLPLQHNEQ